MELIKALGAGLFCGGLFAVFSLPAPAPEVLAGILGIIGIFLGYAIVNALIMRL